MKMKAIAFFAAMLIVALAFSVSSPATSRAAAKAIPGVSAQPAPNVTADPAPEPHPEIREAIASLRRAKEHMQHAAHDFGGHRVEAIEATDNAIRQLELCLKFDKN
jgi:hypothetical protein